MKASVGSVEAVCQWISDRVREAALVRGQWNDELEDWGRHLQTVCPECRRLSPPPPCGSGFVALAAINCEALQVYQADPVGLVIRKLCPTQSDDDLARAPRYPDHCLPYAVSQYLTIAGNVAAQIEAKSQRLEAI